MEGPNFLIGGNSQGGFGRCNSSCLPPAPPPDAFSMLSSGIVGFGALRLLPGSRNVTAAGGWLHAALNTVDTHTTSTNVNFAVEVWIRVPSACAASANNNFSFVLASTDYAVALKVIEVQDGGSSGPSTTARVLWPLFFWTAAPSQQCVAGPLVLTDSTGSIGDGPGQLARDESQGPLSCSWILAPGGGGGGDFQDVTLFFTEFLLTSYDSLALASCEDINCTSTTEPTVFTGASVPPPFVSTTPVMLVTLMNNQQNQDSSSAGFTASYAGTPVLPAALPGLAGDAWHHIALSVNASGRLSLVINGTQQLTQQITWDPAPVQNPLTRGTDVTAIGLGAPAWQGVFGHSCLEVDELRFWTEARTASEIAATMKTGCQSVAAAVTGCALAACYSFDAAGIMKGGELGNFFPDASQNQIPAFTAALDSPHLPWCVNIDDEGELRLDALGDNDWPEMWGYCTKKPRLPGAGFEYNEADMEEAAARRLEGTAAVLEHYPGCGDIPLR
jgi:hypothetical protein